MVEYTGTMMEDNNYKAADDNGIEMDGFQFQTSLTSMVTRHNIEDNRGGSMSTLGREDGDIGGANARLLELYLLCERATEEDMDTWEDVRQWLRMHTTAEAREAAMMTGEGQATPLFLACRNCAPTDIIEVLVGVAPRTVEMENNLGYMPI